MPNYRNEPVNVKPVDIECSLKSETDKAWLVETDNLNEVWVPKSIGEWEPDKHDELGVLGTMTVPTWFAEKEGLD